MPEIFVEEHYRNSKKVREKFCYYGERKTKISLYEHDEELASGNSIPEFVRNIREKKVITALTIQNKNNSEIDISLYRKSKSIIIRRGLTNSELEELVKTLSMSKI